jgi:endonuclease-3
MPRESKSELANRARRIVAELHRLYPDARCSLDFADPLQLLVATVLSAQCTDERVNRVTPGLFGKFPTAEAFANADLDELMDDIRSTGFFRNKAKAIRSACADIVEHHAGQVPGTMDELTQLPGVGRKTANVILGSAFARAEGIAVDTHVTRLAQRLGLSRHAQPQKIERDLMGHSHPDEWTFLSHALIQHGRRVCTARKPACAGCGLNKLCPSAFTFGKPKRRDPSA